MKLFGSAFFILSALLCINKEVLAQKELPINERDVFYLYQEFGLINQDKPKIVVISSHLYRYKYDDNSHNRMATNLELAFGKKMDEIYNNEYITGEPGYKQLSFSKVLKLNNAFYSQGRARATGPELHLTLSNTTELLKKSRESLIDNFQKDGYAVFQVDFGEYIDFNNLGLEKIEKLSSLWITPYRKGDLRTIVESYQRRSGSAGSGITVEEKKSKSSSTTSTTKREDETNWEAIASAKRWEAGLFESEGDRFLNSGSFSDAISSYKKAQEAFYTDRVQQKLDNAEITLKAGSAAIVGALDLTQDVSIAFDQMKVPKFSAWGITHDGLAPDNRNKGLSPDLVPSATRLTYGGYRIIAMELGATYLRSPVYTMYLEHGNGNKTNQNIQINRANIGFTVSVGLAIPFKHFVVYGMYGCNIPFWMTEANLLTEGYKWDDMKIDLDRISFEPKTDVGIKIKIPGTRIGLGAHYVFNKISGNSIKLKGNGYSEITKGSSQYYVGGSLHKEYKYEVFGFSLYYLTKR